MEQAREITHRALGLAARGDEIRFKSLFGVSASLCASAWNAIGDAIPKRAFPRHLLWALLLLKAYFSEKINSALTGTDYKTFRKWSWTFVSHLNELKAVSCVLPELWLSSY